MSERPATAPGDEEIRQTGAFLGVLRAELGRLVFGQDALLETMLLAMLTGGHVLVEGVPGLAKTLAVKTLAACLGGSFRRLQFTPDLLPADIIGTSIYNPADHSFRVRPGPLFANLVLADEINRAPAKVQSALLEAMEERQVTIGCETHALPCPFLVLATQNSIEHEGTYPLPEAQADRFMFKALVEYPDRAAEKHILENFAGADRPPPPRQVAGAKEIAAAGKLVERIHMDAKITDYILDLTLATRPQRHSEVTERQRGADLAPLAAWIAWGVSPRAGLALARGARALAFMDGRGFVLPDDVKKLVPAVFRHRLVLTYEAAAEEVTADAVVAHILREIRP